MARRDVVFARKAQISSGAFDHGSLAGLGDDDHTQYHTDARALTWLGSQNVSVLTNDAGYLQPGANMTVMDGTAYRLFYSDISGNVQELAHGTSGQVLTSNGLSSDPSWQTPASSLANVVEDTTPQLGGSLDVNGNKIVSVSNGDIDIEPNGTGNVLLGNFTFDADQTVGAGQDNYVLTYDNGTGLISLEAAAGGSSLTQFQDNGLIGEALYDAEVVMQTHSEGILIQDSADSPNLRWHDSTKEHFRIQVFTDHNVYIDQRDSTDSGDMIFRLSDASTSDTTQLALRNAGAVELYHAGNLVAETRFSGGGLNLYSGGAGEVNPQIRFHTNTSLRGIVYYDDSTNQMVMDARETTDSGIRLSHTGTSTYQTALDSDGTSLYGYYNGTQVWETYASGLDIQRGDGGAVPVLNIHSLSATGGGAINFQQHTNGAVAQIQYVNATDLDFRTYRTGEGFRFYNDVDGDLLNIVANGIEVRPATAANGHVYVYDQNGEFGLVRKLDTGETQLYGGEHGSTVELIAENAVGTATDVIVADPDGATEVYYAGTKTFATDAGGGGIYDDSGDGPRLSFYEDNGTLLGRVEVATGSTAIGLVNFDHGGLTRLQAEDALGTRQTLLTGDPDGAVELYYDGTATFGTTSYGAQMQGFLSLGAGTELTISSGAITATESFHSVDTQGDASTDDLDTINHSAGAGSILVLRAVNSTRTVVCKDGTGNLRLNGDFSMTHLHDTIMLLWISGSSVWLEISRSDNTA